MQDAVLYIKGDKKMSYGQNEVYFLISKTEWDRTRQIINEYEQMTKRLIERVKGEPERIRQATCDTLTTLVEAQIIGPEEKKEVLGLIDELQGKKEVRF